MTLIETQLKELLARAKQSKKGVIELKKVAVKLQHFDMAASMREMEKELFPDTEEILQSKQEADQVKIALGLVGVRTDEEMAWIINETVKLYHEKKGDFAISD